MNLQTRYRFLVVFPSLVLVLSSNLYYFWVKIGGPIFIQLGIGNLILFIISLVYFIKLIRKTIKIISWRNYINYFSLISFFVSIFLLISPSYHFSADTFQSPVKIRACYEGTMNTSKVFFREDGTFEDFNIGFFAYVHYSHGTWYQDGDTLKLKFESKNRSGQLSDNLLIKDNILFNIVSDTLSSTHYYLGYCKGLN